MPRINRKTNALANLAIFTPLAYYAWQGKRPPKWLMLAAGAYGAWRILEDVQTLSTNNAGETSHVHLPSVAPPQP